MNSSCFKFHSSGPLQQKPEQECAQYRPALQRNSKCSEDFSWTLFLHWVSSVRACSRKMAISWKDKNKSGFFIASNVALAPFFVPIQFFSWSSKVWIPVRRVLKVGLFVLVSLDFVCKTLSLPECHWLCGLLNDWFESITWSRKRAMGKKTSALANDWVGFYRFDISLKIGESSLHF